MTTYMFSGQFNGCSILYPDFKSSNRFSKGTPGYGDPPNSTKTKSINQREMKKS